MKHSKTKKLFAAALAATMVTATMPTTAFAANSRVSQSSWSGFSFSWDSLWDRLFGRGNANQGSSTVTPEEPKEPETSSPELTLLEDESTVENGEMLRASTYALTDAGVSALADNSEYSEVTDPITWADLITDNGTDVSTIYYWSSNSTNYYPVTVTRTSSGIIKIRYNYTLKANGETIASAERQSNGSAPISLTSGKLYTKNAVLKYFPVTMYNYDAATINAATAAKDGNTGTGIYFNDGDPSSLTGSDGGTGGTYNYWTGNTIIDKIANGDRTYSGLVESTLTANKDISFTKPDGGIFNSDATIKDIYTNVELPFEYDSTTKYYEFNAKKMGARFNGTPASNVRLAYSQTPQKSTNTNVQDENVNGYVYGWYPYNDADIVTDNTADYHFGMRATIPFTMTSNGKMSLASDAADIEFQFEGDDDVWVFIDGQLVLDLGGIHNRMKGTLNFANNTYEISAARTNANTASDVNGASLTGKIFNDDAGNGKINTTRETFAATDSHELSIFYLDRGKGTSNCQIKFNLPMKDVVTVTKRATQSISSNGTLSPLTAKEQETVNNIDFGFTLTKNGTPVANTNYNLMNANGQVISTPSTDANGHFTLRNGQTARFVGEIAADGAEYQVVEDAVDSKGFELPTYTYGGKSAGGFTVSSTSYSEGSAIPATEKHLTSAAVTAKGSTEAEDSLQFICENYFDANLPNPSSRPVDDKIVIDYGLPVVIDALANDVYRGDTIELTDVTGAQYGTATIENGKITYKLTKQLTGVEVLTYTATVTGADAETLESNTAKIYIIPATSMYYEENFSDLVMYSDGWSNVGTAQTDPQEPGVVGTVGDSPYGSDAAYLNDSGDSNGSSKYVNTENAAAAFKYTFTGTGTSFFARTTNNSGYIRVVIKDSTDKQVYTSMRDTSYKTEEGKTATLYNIPVFTYEAENYGTYTVTVTIAGGVNAQNYGKEFWLDGIRVVNPLNSSDVNASIANAAYAADGEANMTFVTLRQKLIGEAQINADGTISWNKGDNFVLFTDTNDEITSAEEYKSNGPKEEVYLNKDQSVTFSLKNWDPNTNKIYLGVKAPLGSGSVSISGHSLTIGNASDCYYDISDYKTITEEDGVKTATFEIKATSSLISVTNIKVTGNAEFTIVNQDDENVDDPENDVNVD